VVFYSTVTEQFTYSSQQLGDKEWGGKNVLDFGGNIGNILRDPNSTIDEERYWCLDVAKASIQSGKRLYPRARWLLYNRYSFFFNPYGVSDLPLPRMEQTFDYIVAFSVFTNTTKSDMIKLVSQLEGILSEGGTLAFTFIDPNHLSCQDYFPGNNFEWRLDLEVERGNLSASEIPVFIERTKDASWFILVNGNDLYVEREDIQPYAPALQKSCYAFHTESYMRKLFPHAIILPPANDEMQHCCVIRK